MEKLVDRIAETIRTVPNFPKEGINFYDITTLLQDGELFKEITDYFIERYKDQGIEKVIGIESRGFIFGAALATGLGVPFIPVRKAGKLPAEVKSASYSLEYGEDTLEIHSDALTEGQNVVVIDDLLATGGTAAAVINLCSQLGANVLECCFVVELNGLSGGKLLSPTKYFSLTQFPA